MKTLYLSIICISIFLCSSCDKVRTPYQPPYIDIDTTLLPAGTSLQDYKNNYWLAFENNTNENVNVLIEDFTGHKCVGCPTGAIDARAIETVNEGRVFIASIHAGKSGSIDFQNTVGPLFSHDFTNPNGLNIANELTQYVGFEGNPAGTFNRKIFGGQMLSMLSSSWAGYVATILNENNLFANLQAKTNYFKETRGLFLHTEIDIKPPTTSVTDELFQVVYLIEDSLIASQTTPSSWGNPNNIDQAYVHRDIMRGCLDNQPMGRQITDAFKVDKNGTILTGNKYYINYSYKLPDQYNPENMHLLIYVYNNATKEILQVISKKF